MGIAALNQYFTGDNAGLAGWTLKCNSNKEEEEQKLLDATLAACKALVISCKVLVQCCRKLLDVMLAAYLDSLAGGGVDNGVALAHGATVDAHVGKLTKSALLKLEG